MLNGELLTRKRTLNTKGLATTVGFIEYNKDSQRTAFLWELIRPGDSVHGDYDHELVYAFGYRVLPLRFAHRRNECWPWRRVTQAYSEVTVYNLEGQDESLSSGTTRRNS